MSNEVIKSIHDKLFPKKEVIKPVIKAPEVKKYVPVRVPDVFTQFIEVPVEKIVTRIIDRPIIQEKIVIKEVPVIVEKQVIQEKIILEGKRPPLNTLWRN